MSIPGAVPCGLGIDVDPIGNIACRRLLSGITILRCANLDEIS
jgi:hypothetical protein